MRQPPQRSGLNLGSRLTPAVTWILAISVGSFLVWIFSKDAQPQIAAWLILTPDALLRGHVWKLVTTAILNPNALAFLFNVLMLWVFVPTMEREWGTRRFLWFALATTVAGNLVSALVGIALGPTVVIAGMAPFIFGSIAAFGTVFAHQPVQFFGVLPMKGRTFALAVLVFLVIQSALMHEWIQAAGYVAAMGLAWAFAGGRLTPSVWALRWRRNRLRKKLTVMDGGSPPGTGRPPKKQEWLN